MARLEKLQKQLAELNELIEGGEGYIPRTASGKQRSPNQIRSEIRAYLQESQVPKTKFFKELGVNSKTHSTFMAGAYKDQWSAVQNGTYFAAAQFLDVYKLEKQIAEIIGNKESKAALKANKSVLGKRKVDTMSSPTPTAATVDTEDDDEDFDGYDEEVVYNDDKVMHDDDDDDDEEEEDDDEDYIARPSTIATTTTSKPATASGALKALIQNLTGSAGPSTTTVKAPKAKATSTTPGKQAKAAFQQELATITAVDVPENCPVYANCDEVRRMIEAYLISPGVNQSAWLKAIGNVNNKSLTSFRKMKGKGAGASNGLYQAAWRFFEQKRLHEGKPKTAKHLEQEKRWGAEGFPLHHDQGKRWVFGGAPTDKRIFDIEWCQDQRRARAGM